MRQLALDMRVFAFGMRVFAFDMRYAACPPPVRSACQISRELLVFLLAVKELACAMRGFKVAMGVFVGHLGPIRSQVALNLAVAAV
jgi:hypothetical protein